MQKIMVNEFAERHTAPSPYSHYDGSWDALIGLVNENFDQAKKGFRDGVLLVPVPASGFFCPVVQLQPGDKVEGTFSPRQDGEASRLHTLTASGSKLPANVVHIIIYSHDVLAEKDEYSHDDSDWEIIMIQAAMVEDEPQHYISLISNHFGISGGTDTKMSDEEFVKTLKISYLYWRDKALARGA